MSDNQIGVPEQIEAVVNSPPLLEPVFEIAVVVVPGQLQRAATEKAIVPTGEFGVIAPFPIAISIYPKNELLGVHTGKISIKCKAYSKCL